MQLGTLDDEVLAATHVDYIDAQIEQADEVKVGLYTAVARINLCLSEHKKARPTTATTHSSTSQHSHRSAC